MGEYGRMGVVCPFSRLTLDGARSEVEAKVGRGKKAPGGHIPFTPRAKKILELSLREALKRGHNYIGTEHMLLGIVFTGGPVTDALTALGLAPQRAEELINAEIAAYQSRKAAN